MLADYLLFKEPAIPYPLTTSKKPGLTSVKFEYSDDLPEYPATDTYGYSYVVASRGRTQLEMEQLPHDVSALQVTLRWLASSWRMGHELC